MRFYYFSLFSWMAWAVYGVIGIALLTLIWTRLLKLRVRNTGYWVLAAGVLVAPWIEELWIAYNFDRLCRADAGVFITKTVEVDGFYDDTHGWRPDKLRASGYKFVEGRDRQSFWRHEYVGNEIRSTKIEKPAARYRYMRVDNHTSVAHGVKRFENVVVDNQSGGVLGRYTNYRRGPYWFFVSLDAPTIECRELHGKDILVYPHVLKPTN